MTQEKIDENAQKVLELFNRQNSSVCVLSLLSVIEHLSFSSKASVEFKEQTAHLLLQQHLRLKGELNPPSQKVN